MQALTHTFQKEDSKKKTAKQKDKKDAQQAL